MDVNNIDEKTLLHRAQQFDEKALSEIYDIYSPRVYRYAMRLLGNQQIVEECLSETFLRFLKMLHHSQGPVDHLQAYLYRVAHNWIIDYYCKSNMEPDELSDDIAVETNSVEEQAHQNIQVSKIRKALLSLPMEQQQIIILKYLEGRENEDIAILLKKNNGAIRSQVFRAINALRRELQKKEKHYVS